MTDTVIAAAPSDFLSKQWKERARKAATLETQIGPSDTVKTGARSSVIFVAGGHPMILRSDSHIHILGGEPPGKNIRSAPFINHTDQELMLVEALVGRTPPFVFPDDKYPAPRRRY